MLFAALTITSGSTWHYTAGLDDGILVTRMFVNGEETGDVDGVPAVDAVVLHECVNIIYISPTVCMQGAQQATLHKLPTTSCALEPLSSCTWKKQRKHQPQLFMWCTEADDAVPPFQPSPHSAGLTCLTCINLAR